MNESIKIRETVKETLECFEKALIEGFQGTLKVYCIGGTTSERINKQVTRFQQKTGLKLKITACDDVKENCFLFEAWYPSILEVQPQIQSYQLIHQ